MTQTTRTTTTAIALIALFVLLGSTGFAATQLSRGPAAVAGAKRKPHGRKKTSINDPLADKTLFNALFSSEIAGAHVAFAAGAGSANTAATATAANHATSATTAETAANATNAVHATSASSAPLPATLPSGQSLEGAYGAIGSATAASQRLGTAISFGVPLAIAPTANFIAAGTGSTAKCPGTPARPAAAPGNLCIYESIKKNVQFESDENPITGETGGAVEPFGAEVVAKSSASGNYDESGSWAVTAP
jgi:hypothetical protein